jgi:TatD DNase family protein
MLAPAMLIDSHCHLDFPDFAADRDAVVGRARAAGVGRMVTICTHVRQFDKIRAIAQAYPDVYCSLGTHPVHAAEEPDVTTAELVALVKAEPRIVGIGECGLDYFHHDSPPDVQAEVFRRHIRAARETGLPLIVHTRDAEADTMRILREEAPQGDLSGILHCFTGSTELARAALDFGFSISISGILTFKSAAALRETVEIVPLDRLLVETDAPYLAPMPHRGKRNEPAFVVNTATVLATLKGVTFDVLAAASTANFLRLFTRVAPL